VPLSQVLNGASWSAVESNPLLPFAAIGFNARTDTLSVDINALVQSIVQAAPSDLAAASAYYEQSFNVVKDLRVDLFGEDSAQLLSAFRSAPAFLSLSTGVQDWLNAQLGAVNLVTASHSGTTLSGTHQPDVFLIDQGGHTVSGGSDDDSFVYFKAATGNTIISDGGLTYDRLILPDLDPADVSMSRAGDDLVIAIASTGATLTIQRQFEAFARGVNYQQIEEFRFADGTVWTPDDVRTHLLAQAKTAGDDTIVGFETADTLDGGAGNDLLEGQGGGDTYIFGRGCGHDTIDAYIVYVTRGQSDTLRFNPDVAPGDLQFVRSSQVEHWPRFATRRSYDAVLSERGPS
jgi:Ca2+-binding RTX toxin-like protein